MKKIFAFLLALMLVCSIPIVAFAEDAPADEVITEGVGEDNSTTEEETPTEGEIPPPETVPEETPEEVPKETPTETPEETEPDWENVKQTISDKIVNWITPHVEEISVIITLLCTLVYNLRRNRLLDKSVVKLNNNAVSIAENSSSFIDKALSNMEGVSGAVTGYQTEIALLLAEFRANAEDKKRVEEDKKKLEAELSEIHKYLKLSKDANVEFANELAELLSLANIPNYKKEELGSRHLAAVHAIEEAEAKTETEEVKKDDIEET